ncbi:protein mesh [Lingula anatina]|uniref:Protein mesh n=1 Tax=Lingula anatina TaxID=7574 RepID=A0A1S3HFQ4_LINAN|nr:protein mesh [Lingula anatina]|eukprot:XP_013384885.1 protein mesh [Lingula anatina]
MDRAVICWCFVFCGVSVFPMRESLADVLFDSGPSVGDSSLRPNDDLFSEEIQLQTKFPYFDRLFSSLFVNTNGAVSFLRGVRQFVPDPFPLNGTLRIVSPFWADVDIRRGGNVFYREVTATTDAPLLIRATAIIHNAFIKKRIRLFAATWAFVATWDNVTYYPGSHPNTTNTFQVVLVTNGRHSFAIFNYGKMMWSYRGKGQAGFNAGDGVRSYTIDGSRTPAVVNVSLTSNVGQPGRWVFRVDEAEVKAGGCNTKGSLVLSPVTGNILGGHEVVVWGPCFTNDDDVVCRFDDTDVPGRVENNLRATCVTPPLFSPRRTQFKLSMDGGESFTHHGLYYPVYRHEQSDVRSRFPTKWGNGRSAVIEWEPEMLHEDKDTERIHVDLLTFKELSNGTVQQQWYEIASNVPNNGEYEIETIPTHAKGIVGAVRITPALPPALEKWRYKYRTRAIWTDIHVLPTTNVLATLLSEDWDVLKTYTFSSLKSKVENLRDGVQNSLEDVQSVSHLWDKIQGLSDYSEPACLAWYYIDAREALPADLEPCPVTLQQALRDRGRFQADETCRRDRPSCGFHPGARHCVRSNDCSNSGAGQQCCYDSRGLLMNVIDSPGGGTLHKAHVNGCPESRTKRSKYISHAIHDIAPYHLCCKRPSAKSNICSETYFKRRPSNDGWGYVPPRPAITFGDPHVVTLDGLKYTFNGIGEYSLLESTNHTFTLQGRASQLAGRDGQVIMATAWTSLAMAGANTSRVQVSVDELTGIEVMVDDEIIDFEELGNVVPGIEGIEIELLVNKTTVLVSFDVERVFLEVRENSGVLNFMLYLPNNLKGHVTGLLGVWNDNPDDDLQSRDGNILDSEASLEDIHYKFGETWRTEEQFSLFTYGIGESHGSHQNASFRPIFELLQLDNETLQAEIEAVCGESVECRFDYTATGGNAALAAASQDIIVTYAEVVSDTKPVISCGFLSSPVNGMKDTVSSLAGTMVTFTCEEGYTLIGPKSTACQEDGYWSNDGDVSCIKDSANDPALFGTVAIGVGSALGAIWLVIIISVIVIKMGRHRKRVEVYKKRPEECASERENDC